MPVFSSDEDIEERRKEDIRDWYFAALKPAVKNYEEQLNEKIKAEILLTATKDVDYVGSISIRYHDLTPKRLAVRGRLMHVLKHTSPEEYSNSFLRALGISPI